METNKFGVKEIPVKDARFINGGGFAYDFGFFLRECVIYLANGAGITGQTAAVVDVSLNYSPLPK
jgi:hypothetical protein